MNDHASFFFLNMKDNTVLYMYLDVLFAVDIHVDERAEPDQTLSHFHIALPAEQNGNNFLKNLCHTCKKSTTTLFFYAQDLVQACSKQF